MRLLQCQQRTSKTTMASLDATETQLGLGPVLAGTTVSGSNAPTLNGGTSVSSASSSSAGAATSGSGSALTSGSAGTSGVGSGGGGGDDRSSPRTVAGPVAACAALHTQERTLVVKVIGGHNLAKKDIFGASDPYVRISVLLNEQQVDAQYTRTRKRTLNPEWNEEFRLSVIPHRHKVLVEVFDENRLTRDDFLGLVELPLQNIGDDPAAKFYVLRPRSSKSRVRGHLQLVHYFTGQTASNEASTTDRHELGDGSREDPTEQLASVSLDSTWEVVTGNQDEAALPLPHGWEERVDANGRTYYVNHILRTTQWNHPHTGHVHRHPGQQQQQHQHHHHHHETGSGSNGSGNAGGSTNNISASATSGNNGPAGGDPTTEIDGCSSSGTGTAASGDGGTSQHQHHQAGEAAGASSTTGRASSNYHNSRVVGGDGSSASSTSLGAGGGSSSGASASQGGAFAVSAGPSSQAGGTAPGGGGCQRRVHISQEDRLSVSSSQQPQQQQPQQQHQTGWPPGQLDTNGLPVGWSAQIAPNGRIFFIDHNTKTTTWTDPRTGKPSHISASGPLSGQGSGSSSATSLNEKQLASASVDELGPLPDGWEERIHTDGRTFFIDHTNRRTQWEDPRFNNPELAGPAVPYSRDYKRKYEYFKSKLPKPPTTPSGGHAKLELRVTRPNIFEDAYMQVSSVTKTELLRTKLWVEFDTEEVLDYGGASREFFCLLSKEMFNPYYGLFEYSAADNYTLQVNPMSGVCNENHIPYFKFIGRVAGMAVYHGKLLEAFFIRPFYKMMLGKNITLKDMESVDTEYFRSLKWIQDNDPEELDLRFCVDEDLFGHTQERELKPGGAAERVTQANKAEYIDLVISWRFVSRIQPQMNAFLEGFNEVVPLQLLKVFDESELELLMCGIGKIDVRDWHVNTLYKGGYHPNQLVIQWFWRLVLSFDNEMRARLLQFVTGTSRLPMNGFKELQGSNGPQQFTIEKWGSSSNLPRSHTCFNRIDLPPYESYQELRDKLIKAIEGSESFGGVD